MDEEVKLIRGNDRINQSAASAGCPELAHPPLPVRPTGLGANSLSENQR
jgi:hypothetical protein